MSYSISTLVGYGAILKVPRHYECSPIDSEEGVIYAISGDNGGSYKQDQSRDYIMITDTVKKIDRYEEATMDWIIRIPTVEQYKLDLWRDKIIAFCAKRNIEFEEPCWMVNTFGG